MPIRAHYTFSRADKTAEKARIRRYREVFRYHGDEEHLEGVTIDWSEDIELSRLPEIISMWNITEFSTEEDMRLLQSMPQTSQWRP